MKETVQKLPKILKCSPKWRNFDKSGHTDPSFPELKCFRGFFILERRLQPRATITNHFEFAHPAPTYPNPSLSTLAAVKFLTSYWQQRASTSETV